MLNVFALALDINYDMFNKADIVLGKDVTAYFEEDICQPVWATIIDPCGPGGGNPVVKFFFNDHDHAWEWFSQSGVGSGEDAMEEFEAAESDVTVT